MSNNNDLLSNFLKKKSKQDLLTIILILIFLILIICIGLGILFINNLGLNTNIKNLEKTNNELNINLDNTLNSLKISNSKNDVLQKSYNSKVTEINNFKNEYQGAYKVPYVVMRGRNAEAVFKKINGEIQTWTWPADSFENAFKQGYYKRDLVGNTFVPILTANCETVNQNTYATYEAYFDLCNVYCTTYASCNCRQQVQTYYNSYLKVVNDCRQEVEDVSKQGLILKQLEGDNGKTFSVIDVTGFVEDNLFDNVIDTIYDSSKSDLENIEEIWNINNQLTTYSSELEDTPRYSLETLSEGGGDCEDKAILVASLLKSIPKNWKISLVYMDSDNPTNPKTVNHVIVQVDTGDNKIFIETTAPEDGLNVYTNVVGWYFEV
jgi:hypothetical protein